MPASITDIKKILSQYGLVKGNDDINEKVIERAAQIVFREFEVSLKSEALLEQDLVDLSNTEAKPQAQKAAVSSDTEPVKTNTRPPKSIEEQIAEVERERAKPVPIPSEEERVKYQEGQRAIPTEQQTHFQKIFSKIAHAQEANEPRRGAARSLSGADEVDEGDLEAFFGEGDEEAIMSIDEERLGELFGDAPTTGAQMNPKDALALQRTLPKRLGQEGESKGSGRSISRLS